ncbi:IS110 family transposase [Marinitoga lauensis]|uniref:IS110 family transposase n=1 Tax=Marinitoga lauensis TaxID=2201189 RepID=UPI001011D688
MLFVLEPTGIYSNNIIIFLKSHGFNNLYIVAPYDVSNTRKILNWPKTDKLDAKIIQKTAHKFPENLTPFVPKDSFLNLLENLLALDSIFLISLLLKKLISLS